MMREITIDCDMKFADYLISKLFEKTKKFAKISGYKMQIRPSSRGNVHVRLLLPEIPHNSWIEGDTVALQDFAVRAEYGDDANRLKLDLIRYVRGEETNRLWDEKLVNGIVQKSGEWTEVNVDM